MQAMASKLCDVNRGFKIPSTGVSGVIRVCTPPLATYMSGVNYFYLHMITTFLFFMGVRFEKGSVQKVLQKEMR
jgi:hypothetical protein